MLTIDPAKDILAPYAESSAESSAESAGTQQAVPAAAGNTTLAIREWWETLLTMGSKDAAAHQLFQNVPSADDDAEPDPHARALRGHGDLPASYMPPAMAGPRSHWARMVALVLIGVFVSATAAGVCLTYGPPLFGR
ncbi:MAG: hypothetical protein WBO42_09050 [Candidatus Nanopelagicales bacterium]